MRLAPAIALAVVTVLALGACQQQSTPIVPTPAPSASPLFASDEEALAAAEEAYRAFQEMSDQILRDGGENPERLKDFVTDEVYAKEAEGYAQAKQNGWRQTGTTEIPQVLLESHTELTPTGGAIVVIYVCTDISQTDIVDQTGASIVTPGRPEFFPFEAGFSNSPEGDHLVLASNDLWTGGGFCVGSPSP